MTKPKSSFDADTPISSVGDDKFGRADFARNVAKSIVGVPAQDGFVFGLNASWGSGKTSTLNMIQEALREDAQVSDGKEFVIVNFNPWWFSGGDSLAYGFLGQLGDAMKKKGIENPDRWGKLSSIAERIDALGGIIQAAAATGVVAEPHMAMTVAAQRLMSKCVNFFKRKASSSVKDIHGIRENIRDLLGGMSDLRVLVVMDDLDRIQPNEMREMFRLVKGVADFPNTIYLLSFDREVVVDALTDKGADRNGRDNAEKYLEKIIQMSLDLPLIEKTRLLEYFDIRLAEMFPPRMTDEWDISYWDFGILYDAASHFINTPRDVNRWINNVGGTYSTVQGEVNPMDFVAIQGLRTFAHGVYRGIGSNKPLFVETPWESKIEVLMRIDKEQEEQQFKKKAESLRADFQKTANGLGEHAEKVVSAIFPLWKSRFSERDDFTGLQPSLMDVTQEEAFQRKMAKHPKIFGRYFSLSLSAGDFSSSEMMQRISLATTNPAKFCDMLLTLAKEEVPGVGYERLRVFLGYLREIGNTKEVMDHAFGIISAFLAIGDKPEVMSKSLDFTDFEIVSNVMRGVAQALLENIPDENMRFDICRKAYEDSDAVKTMWEWIYIFRMLGRRPRPVLRQEHCNALEKIAADKLRALAKNGNVWDWPNPFWMLCKLGEEVGVEERRNCVREAIATPEGFADFAAEWLEIYLPEEWENLVELSSEDIVNKAREILNKFPKLDDTRQEMLRRLIDKIENPRPTD